MATPTWPGDIPHNAIVQKKLTAQVSAGVLYDAPSTGQGYGRQNNSWQPVILQSGGTMLGPLQLANLVNAANDAAAAVAGVQISELYRNGSVVMIRVS